jgi:integrase
MRFPEDATMNLTDRTARAERLPAGKTDAIVFDAKLPGFGLRIRSGGKKTWVAQYRFGTAQRRLNIGSIQEVNAAKARQSAADIFAKVRLGQDPQAERRSEQQKAGDVFEELGQRYLKAAKVRLRPGSYREVERHIEKYWAPFNRRSIHAINRADVAKRIGEIAESSGVVTANRARATLAAVFTWAMRQGELEANPVTATNKAGEESPRDRVLPDSELVEVWKACRADDFGTIVRLLIMTGQRREEVGGMADSEISVEKRLWSLPRDRTKNNLPHDVPLSATAIALLEAHPRRPKRDLIFGDTESRPFSGWSRARLALDVRISEARTDAGNHTPLAPFTLHDLRRSMATRLGDLGIQPHVIEALLNHISGSKSGVAGIYNRATYAAEKRQAVDIWAAHIEGLLAGKTLNVVQLRG